MNARVLAVFLGLAIAAAVACANTGCQMRNGSAETTVGGDTGEPETLASRENDQIRAGALAWTQNCMRCHNLRNPNERSDREWDVIVHHMRVRANLTAEEHRLILRFLQSAN